jgi:hypothetical protein
MPASSRSSSPTTAQEARAAPAPTPDTTADTTADNARSAVSSSTRTVTPGLGLALVDTYVRTVDGSWDLRFGAGTGATLTVTVPLTDGCADDAASPVLEGPGSPRP